MQPHRGTESICRSRSEQIVKADMRDYGPRMVIRLDLRPVKSEKMSQNILKIHVFTE